MFDVSIRVFYLLFQKMKPKSTRPPPPFPSESAAPSQSQRAPQDITSPQSPRDVHHPGSDSDDAEFSDELLDLEEEELLQPSQRFPASQGAPGSQNDEVIVVGSDMDNDVASPSDSPPSVESQAMDLGFDEVLRLIASRTDFSTGEPHAKKQEAPRMGAQFVRDDPTSPYVALSPSLNVLQCAELAQRAAAEAPMAHKTTHVAPPAYPRAKIKQFCFSDDRISLQPAVHVVNNIPAWMCRVSAPDRVWTMDRDLAALELAQRESLAAISYLDALQTASFGVVKSMNHPVLLRFIMIMANALLELCQRSVYSLQAITTLRRDGALHGARMSLPQDTMSELRNAPCIGSRHLFDPKLVQRINEQQVARANDSLAMRAYMTPSLAQKPPKQQWSQQSKPSQPQPSTSGKRSAPRSGSQHRPAKQRRQDQSQATRAAANQQAPRQDR